ncbi:hypothetical protein AC578_5218 [Pseudocercospora eumusae]|uniref:Uncharacterized protein n=1 Tax=Pseudocercospora eumusae TaxID=321146 RepID=A0A139HDT2_9PEZI|nr:hypothetical protein AC578_5218 [Pseudocercospora eumusae]
MPASRAILAFTAVLLIAGGIVMEFLVILSGLNSSPLNQVYFLQADTTGITGANDHFRNPARWTYLAICGVDGGRNANCNPRGAAIPFSPVRNFGTTNGVPEQFIGTNSYYYLSRVAWAFYLVALFFSVCTFFTSIAAYFARLGAYMTGFFALLAFVFQALCSALMTAWTVKARKAFRSNNQSASLGVKAYAFSWASTACFLFAAVLFCVGGSVGKNKNTKSKGYFGRKKSTRSNHTRGSFIETNERGIKDDHSFERSSFDRAT